MKVKGLIAGLISVMMITPVSFADNDGDFPMYENNGIIYEYTVENNEITIVDYDCGNARTMEIPAEIDGKRVTKIGDYASSSADNYKTDRSLTEVVVPDGITEIGAGAFSYLEGLKKITLPDSVTKIGAGAFQDCPRLTEFTVPPLVTEIPDRCFKDCAALEALNWLPEKIKSIGADAFENTPWLKNYEGEYILIDGGKTLAIYCGSAEAFEIPAEIAKVGARAFSHNDTVKSVTIPQKFDHVDEYAFYNSSVETVNFEGNISYIGQFAFSGANLKSVTIPDGTQSLAQYAFCDCKRLESVKIPESVTSIGEHCFSGCEKIKSIKLPSGLETLGNQAFYQCTALESVNIPDKLKSAQHLGHVFGSTNLKHVEFNGDATPQLYSSFGAELIGAEQEEFTIIDGVLMKYNGTDKNPTVPDGVKEIAVGAFAEADIDTVTFPASVKTIKQGAFQSAAIKEVTIPATIETVESNAFAHCHELKRVVIEKGGAKISAGAFGGAGVTEVEIADGMFVSKEAFKNTPYYDGETDVPEETSNPKETAAPIADLTVKSVNGELEITADGNVIEFPDAKPFIDENGRTQIPLRAVTESLGAAVDWNGENQHVSVNGNGTEITLIIGSDIMNINGEPVQMDTSAVIIGDRTYVPLRYVAEAMGMTVTWE